MGWDGQVVNKVDPVPFPSDPDPRTKVKLYGSNGFGSLFLYAKGRKIAIFPIVNVVSFTRKEDSIFILSQTKSELVRIRIWNTGRSFETSNV